MPETQNPFEIIATAMPIQRGPRPPSLPEELPAPVCPLNWFDSSSQDLLQHLIDTGEIRYAMCTAMPVVAYDDLNPYLPFGSDESDSE